MSIKSTAVDSAIASAAKESGSRDKLLAATLELLAGGCLHTISLRDIANAAKVNSALISYYFGGKDQLYAALVKQQFDDYQQLVVSRFTCEGDSRENLKAVSKAIAEFHASHPYFLLLYFRELTNPSASYETVILPCIAESVEKANAMVQAGINRGDFKPDTNPSYVVQSMVALVNYCHLTNRLQKDLKLATADNIGDYLEFTTEMLLQKIST